MPYARVCTWQGLAIHCNRYDDDDDDALVYVNISHIRLQCYKSTTTTSMSDRCYESVTMGGEDGGSVRVLCTGTFLQLAGDL